MLSFENSMSPPVVRALPHVALKCRECKNSTYPHVIRAFCCLALQHHECDAIAWHSTKEGAITPLVIKIWHSTIGEAIILPHANVWRLLVGQPSCQLILFCRVQHSVLRFSCSIFLICHPGTHSEFVSPVPVVIDSHTTPSMSCHFLYDVLDIFVFHTMFLSWCCIPCYVIDVDFHTMPLVLFVVVFSMLSCSVIAADLQTVLTTLQCYYCQVSYYASFTLSFLFQHI